jgi:hypothetical protein
VHIIARSYKLSRSHDECNEQGASMMPFLDYIPIKGCAIELKDETTDEPGICQKFIVDHIRECEKVLQSLEYAHLTLSKK